MIILTKENIENNEQFSNIIEKEKKLIISTMESQNTLKNIFLDYMQKLAVSTNNVDSNHSDDVLNILKDFKDTLALFNINQDLLNNLLETLDNIVLEFCNKDKSIDLETINNFNMAFFEKNETVTKNTIQMEKFLHSMLQFAEFTFCTKNDTCISDTTFLNEAEQDKNLVQPVTATDIVENTLIISEVKGKVFLPYTISTLNEILTRNPDKYSCIEDIMEKEYTLPFNSFKSPAIARFREAFNLIRKKEKKSITAALDLGIELLFNYNLHPAIIAACKNLDELDFYLECLENNETNKFDCFKIIFDIAPVSTKDD